MVQQTFRIVLIPKESSVPDRQQRIPPVIIFDIGSLTVNPVVQHLTDIRVKSDQSFPFITGLQSSISFGAVTLFEALLLGIVVTEI